MGLISCKSRTIKPKPEIGKWEKCHICNGYGTIETYKLKEPAIEERDKNADEFYGCCLDIFLSSNKSDTYNDQIEEQKLEGRYQDPYTKNSGLEKEIVNCNYCSARGWLKKK